MAISFPSSPVAGTSIYAGGRQWTYDGSNWNLVLGGSYELYWTHTGTGGETTLSGSSDNGTTLTYPLGGENVYLNGVLLYRGQDYTATTGTTIVLANPLALSDIVTVVSYPAVQMSSNNIAQTTEPTTYTPGMVWVNTAGNAQGLQLVRWKKTPSSGTTVLSGLADDGTTTLAYTAGYEEVYVNGILIVKGVDYTATNGTSITLAQATVTGDTVEVFNTITMGVTNTYTQSQSDSRYLQPAGYGNDGQVPVSSYGSTGGYVWQGQQIAGKNKIINGDFGIWQRGTTFNSISTNTYTADRFLSWFDGSGSTRNITQQTFTPGAAPVAGYESTYFLRYSQTVAGTGATYNNFGQRMEDIRTFAGQTATFSFWARAATSTTFSAYAGQEFGTGGSTPVYTQFGTWTVGTTWQRYTGTIVVPSIAGKTIGTSPLQFAAYFSLPNNSTFTIDFWGIQLEAGSIATPFTTATGTFQGELAACQRYYWRYAYNSPSDTYFTGILGWANSSSQTRMIVNYPVTMRTQPSFNSSGASTFAIYSAGNGYGAGTSIGLVSSSQQSCAISVSPTTTTLTPGSVASLNANNTSSAYLEFIAEL